MLTPLQQVEQRLHNLRSPKRGHTFWGLLGIMGICTLLVTWQHWTWVSAPNAYLLGNTAKTYKNYMTTAWHVSHDPDYLHYGGMNHPYGEHVLFTDNQPLLSAAMQWWNWRIANLNDHIVAIVNRFQWLSLVFACGFLFLLFRKLHFPVWYAGLTALVLTFLAPQYQYIDQSFGLSHTFVIPMLLYWLCRYEERQSRRYQSLHIGFGVFLTAQLHFYYFGLAVAFFTAYLLFQIFRDFRWSNIRARISHWIVMIVFPYLLLTFWQQISDYALDRPLDEPSFLTNLGCWEGVLLPPSGFALFEWLSPYLVRLRTMPHEAIAYAGFFALPFTLWLLFSGFRMFGRKWGRAAYHRTHRHYLRGILVAGMLTALFAFGFPFALPSMRWMTADLGLFQQFRHLGRFTWIYYYTLNIPLLYALWNVSVRYTGLKNGGWEWLRWPIALGPVWVLAIEAFIFQHHKHIELRPNVLRKEAVTSGAPKHWLNTVDFSSYQALLPLPYYHIGAEIVRMGLQDSTLFEQTQLTAFHTGIPDLGVFLDRTSTSQALKSIQFALLPAAEPLLLNDLDDTRPIAIMADAHQWLTLPNQYPHLLRKAEPIYEGNGVKILRVWPDSIRQAISALQYDIRREATRKASIRRDGWALSNASLPFAHFSFDSLTNTPHVFQGSGAYISKTSDTTWLFRANLPAGAYSLSWWLYVEPSTHLDFGYHLGVPNAEGSWTWRHGNTGHHLRAILEGWALLEISFEVPTETTQATVCYLHDSHRYGQSFFIDEVELRAQGQNAYRTSLGQVVKNNVWYRE